MSEDDFESSAEECRALSEWADGPGPPAALEEAVVRRLRESGALRSHPRRGRGALAAAAAGVVLFALGLAVGARRAAPAPSEPSLPQFVLLLYDPPAESPVSEAQMAARVDEYRLWAKGVRAGGAAIRGEKLEGEGRILGPPASELGWPLGGYFVVAAKNWDAAVAVARSCPHLKHGGRIEVRAVART